MDNDFKPEGTVDLPQDKSELLNLIADEWKTLLDLIESLDENQLTLQDHAGWSIKDHLAHISCWERFLWEHHLRNSPAHEALGIDLEIYEKADDDVLNDILVHRFKDHSPKQILDELYSTHNSLIAELEKFPFLKMMELWFEDGFEDRPLLWWIVAETSDHYTEHRITIEGAVGFDTA